MPRVTIPLIGGPFDAASDDDPTGTVDVDLDADGKPPFLYPLRVPGVYDFRADASTGSAMSVVTHFYELEQRGDTIREIDGRQVPGPRWVYVHKGEHVEGGRSAA